MAIKWSRDDWKRRNDAEVENKPFVKEIILPPFLYKHAQKRGYETYKEVGFYLIGLFKNRICYVHDIIEFDYSEQSGGFIESGMARYVRLKAGLPLGLQIVGHMHKHPGFTEYSTTDKQNFRRYGNANPLNAFLIYIVEPSEKIRGYTATSEKIFPMDVSIRDLKPEEMLLEKEVKIEFNTKVLLPKDSSYSDFHFLFTEKVSSESLKFLSRPTIRVDGKPTERNSVISEDATINIVPRKAIEIEDVGNNPMLRYRILKEKSETIADLAKSLKQLINLPQEKGFEIVFFESGRKLPKTMKLSYVRQPLVWNFEKSVLLPIFKNFYEFWEEILKILDDREREESQEPLISPETEVSESQKLLNNSEDMVEIQESDDVPENNTKKKREYKRYKLDYYT